jgi:hypothetical protein
VRLILFSLLLALVGVCKAQTLTITRGGVYSALWISNTSWAIDIQTTEWVTINYAWIQTWGKGITACTGANYTVDNCQIDYIGYPVGPNWTSPQWQAAATQLIYSFNAANAIITHNRFTGSCANHVRLSRDGSPFTGTYIIAGNDSINGFMAAQFCGVNVQGTGWADIYFNRVIDGSGYHTDRINLYESQNCIVQQNFICCIPETSVKDDAAIQAGDINDANETIYGNTILNGASTGISIYYPGCTATVTFNTVLGVGSKQYGEGLYVVRGSGPVEGNSVAWLNQGTQRLNNYQGRKAWSKSNASLAASAITLSAEKEAYAAWKRMIAATGSYVGPSYATEPKVTYPQAGDFPK